MPLLVQKQRENYPELSNNQVTLTPTTVGQYSTGRSVSLQCQEVYYGTHCPENLFKSRYSATEMIYILLSNLINHLFFIVVVTYDIARSRYNSSNLIEANKLCTSAYNIKKHWSTVDRYHYVLRVLHLFCFRYAQLILLSRRSFVP